MIREEATSSLDSQFLLDFPPTDGRFTTVCNGHITPEAKFNLLGEVGSFLFSHTQKATVCVNLLGLCAEPSPRQKQAVFLLPALLRLVVSVERAVNPSSWLEHVNAVVGCPVLGVGDDVVFDELNGSDRDAAVLCQLSEILWVKTVAEVYCDCEDPTIRAEVGVR